MVGSHIIFCFITSTCQYQRKQHSAVVCSDFETMLTFLKMHLLDNIYCNFLRFSHDFSPSQTWGKKMYK